MSFLMLDLGGFKSISFWMECSCMALRTHAVMVIMGLVFQPLLWIARFNGSYLACFCVMACLGNRNSK